MNYAILASKKHKKFQEGVGEKIDLVQRIVKKKTIAMAKVITRRALTLGKQE